MGWLSRSVEHAEAALQEKMARRAMVQREVEMSVSIARARDSLQWFGGLYASYITGLTAASLARKPIPRIAALPAVLGAFGLANLADMAYGTKMTRIAKEAEHIMQHERGRFVPPAQAPFARLYTQAERELYESTDAVGALWPGFLPVSRSHSR